MSETATQTPPATEQPVLNVPEAIPTIVLPRVPIKAATKWPKNMIIFSKPKTGKTTLFAQLKDCLIIDFENGSDFVEGLKLKANSIPELRAIGTAIVAANRPYRFIVADTVTKLEEMCIPMAEQIYAKTSMGKNWFTPETGGKAQYGGILNMPNGAGYPFLREAFMKVIAYLQSLAPNLILSGHIKDTLLAKAGVEFTSSDLDLTGKIKRQICSDSDAIGYLYRKGKQNVISFKSSDEISCGARPEHLRNMDIVISEQLDSGEIVTYWEKIFPPEPQASL